MCDSAYNKMLHSKQFETNLEEGQDTQIVSIHMKVTKTLLLFDETFRGLKAFQGVEGLGDESFLKDCKERLREFQIVLQKVTSLRQSIESYIPKSKTEERVLNTLYSVYASYNKEIIVKAITFASEFEEQITKEDVRIKQLKEQNKKLSIKSISNTVFPIDGGVLKLKLDCPDPEMKVFVNDVKQVATLNKQTLLIQIPKKRGDSDRITIQLESKYGSVSLTDIIFYDGSSKTNTIKSNQHKIPTDHIIYSTSTGKSSKPIPSKKKKNSPETTGSWIKRGFRKSTQRFNFKKESNEAKKSHTHSHSNSSSNSQSIEQHHTENFKLPDVMVDDYNSDITSLNIPHSTTISSSLPSNDIIQPSPQFSSFYVSRDSLDVNDQSFDDKKSNTITNQMNENDITFDSIPQIVNNDTSTNKLLFVTEDNNEDNDSLIGYEDNEEDSEDDESEDDDDEENVIILFSRKKKEDEQPKEKKEVTNNEETMKEIKVEQTQESTQTSFAILQPEKNTSTDIQEINTSDKKWSEGSNWKTFEDFEEDFDFIDLDEMDIKMEILSISPSAFSVKGGVMTVKGKNFGSKPFVFVRNKRIDDKHFISSSQTQIVVTIPSLSEGLATVRIENEFGQSDSVIDALHIFSEIPSAIL